MLSNAYFLAKFRFETAENEPAKNLQNLLNLLNFLNFEPDAHDAVVPGVADEHRAVREAAAGHRVPQLLLVGAALRRGARAAEDDFPLGALARAPFLVLREALVLGVHLGCLRTLSPYRFLRTCSNLLKQLFLQILGNYVQANL